MKRGLYVRGRTNPPSGFANISEYGAVNVETAIQKPYKFQSKQKLAIKNKTDKDDHYLT